MPRIDYQELKALSEEIISLRQDAASYLTDYATANDSFTEDNVLLGMAWSSSKEYHKQYKVISQSIFNALYDLDDSLKSYLAEFKNIVGEAGNRLDTDELHALEDDLRRLQVQKLEFMEAMAEIFKDVPVLREFFGNQSMNGKMKEIEILKRYENFENRTQGSFDGVKETIHAILEGLAYLGQKSNFEGGATGYQFANVSNSSWYKHLVGYNQKNEEDRYEVRIIKTKYATIYQVLKNGLVQKKATADLQQSKLIESVEMMAQLTPEILKALVGIDDIEVLMDDGSTKLQKVGASFWVLLSVLPPEKVKDILKSAKLAKNSGKALDSIHLTEKEWKQLKSLDKTSEVVKVTEKTFEISKSSFKHLLNRHSFDNVKLEIPYLLKKQSIGQVEKSLTERTFFNKNWSNEQIQTAINSSFNNLMNQGMTNGTYVVKQFGEDITIIIEKGNFKTAYGNWSYNLKDFGY